MPIHSDYQKIRQPWRVNKDCSKLQVWTQVDLQGVVDHPSEAFATINNLEGIRRLEEARF